MDDVKTCNQKGCGQTAAYLYTWPGNDQAGICMEHAPKLRGLANALGMHLQLIPYFPEEFEQGEKQS